jgi:hypothetical protein
MRNIFILIVLCTFCLSAPAQNYFEYHNVRYQKKPAPVLILHDFSKEFPLWDRFPRLEVMIKGKKYRAEALSEGTLQEAIKLYSPYKGWGYLGSGDSVFYDGRLTVLAHPNMFFANYGFRLRQEQLSDSLRALKGQFYDTILLKEIVEMIDTSLYIGGPLTSPVVIDSATYTMRPVNELSCHCLMVDTVGQIHLLGIDSMQAMNLLVDANMKMARSAEAMLPLARKYDAACAILGCIRIDGTIDNKKGFKKAVREFLKLTR